MREKLSASQNFFRDYADNNQGMPPIKETREDTR